MKNFRKNFALGLIALTIGCASREENGRIPSLLYQTDSSTDKNSGFISSSAAVRHKDTTRKFIRTADLKFKVKDVRNATAQIEDVILFFDGFVTYTNLASNIDRRTVIPVSNDSSEESTYYTMVNNMVIRIPNIELDTTLKTIAKLIDYLDYRIIKADDATLSLVSNRLIEQKLKTHEGRLTNAIDNRGKKLNETSFAEENLLNKQILSDKAKMANMHLKDQISFSTINIAIYQSRAVKRERIENVKSMEPYKPGFLSRIKESLKTGWIVLEHIIVFFVKIWGILLIGLIAFFIYRKFLYKKN